MPVSHDGLLTQITEILDTPFDPDATSLDEVVTGTLMSNFFVVARHHEFYGANPTKFGDFSTIVGRQYARDLAHDLLLAAERAEQLEHLKNDADINRLANIIVATTMLDSATAREQAQALVEAGIHFTFPVSPATTNTETNTGDAK